MRRIIIGADGGGTKTCLVALDADTLAAVASAECGGIHWLSAGVPAAALELEKGIEALDLGSEDSITAVSVGDPSVEDSDVSAGEDFVMRAAQRVAPGARYFSKSDVFMALYAFSRGEPAALLVAGTGSMGIALTEPYGFSRPARLFTVGGWGERVRDPGSGYHAALSAIGAALDAFDGAGEDTALCQEVLEYFGAGKPRDLIEIFNGGSLTRPFVAGFARRAAECAEAGDAVAAGILRSEGEKLGGYALSLLGALPPGGKKLGFWGGLLTKCRAVREAAEKTVWEKMPDADISVPAVPAEVGAALYAADAMKAEEKK